MSLNIKLIFFLIIFTKLLASTAQSQIVYINMERLFNESMAGISLNKQISEINNLIDGNNSESIYFILRHLSENNKQYISEGDWAKPKSLILRLNSDFLSKKHRRTKKRRSKSKRKTKHTKRH